MSVQFVNSTRGVYMDNGGNVFIFGGSHDQLTFLNGGYDSTIAVGTNQTVELGGFCGPEFIYDFGKGLTLDFGWFNGQVKIYGMQMDKTAQVHVIASVSGHPNYTLAPDGRGGTLLTDNWGGRGTVDFVYDPHVHVTPI